MKNNTWVVEQEKLVLHERSWLYEQVIEEYSANLRAISERKIMEDQRVSKWFVMCERWYKSFPALQDV